ncbi:hypothetical protein O3M35_003275 [Rhynocoris fuscipes]|uniref:Ciliary microtubule inner protein 2A-C-like domain-containing protein n=1 Tax=Rhynocoris fuscipes TaxID=488301 RepID=A0AAW1CR16_9HEMI
MTGLSPKQPYYLTGYTGHCPEMAQRFGSSYSALSHKILLDPLVRHSHKLVLSDTEVADYMINEGKEGRKSKDKSECDRKDFGYQDKYEFPIPPGYKGHLPGTFDTLGDSKTVKAEETIPKLKEQVHREKQVQREIEKIRDIRYGKRKVKDMDDKMLLKDEFSLPLIEVRPEFCSILRNVFKDEQPRPIPNTTKRLPYFMEALEDGKSFIAGYTGHVPFGFAQLGSSYGPASNCALKSFSYEYNSLKSTEWAPVGTLREEPASTAIPHKIYSEKYGLIPNYEGFVPGFQFKVGKTYGEATRDAKRWIRANFSN